MSRPTGDCAGLTYLDREVPQREMSLLLLLPLRHALRLIFCQPSSDGASLLWAEVERDVFLSLVEDSELRSLVCVDDCEDASDRFADIVAVALLLASYSRIVPSTPNISGV